MFIILGGMGIQGRAIVHYLYNHTDEEIVIVDKAEVFKQHNCVDVNDRIKYIDNSQRSKLINYKYESTLISCLSPEDNIEILDMCIKKQWNMVDLGGDTDIVRQQFTEDETAKTEGITIVPDCGLAPGIVSSAVQNCLSLYDFKSVNVFCGGIPKYPNPPLNYSKVFSPQGVVKEYTGISEYIENGKIKKTPALSEYENIFVPGFGILEASNTSGGTSISTEYFQNKLNNFKYMTLRYPGHFKYVKKNILSQLEPVKVLESVMENASKQNPDVILFIVDAVCGKYRRKKGYIWEYDNENDILAMAQATGYVVASVATMVSEGKIRKGVVGMHEIDFNVIKKRCQKEYNQFTEINFG